MGWTGQTTLSFLAPYRGFGIRASVRVFRGHARCRYQRQPAARGRAVWISGMWLSNPEAPRRRLCPLRRTAAKHRAGAPQLAE
jgi:hypothetical protein